MDKNLKSVVAELKKASRMHAAQAKKIDRYIAVNANLTVELAVTLPLILVPLKYSRL